jgi:hypothetical protein
MSSPVSRAEAAHALDHASSARRALAERVRVPGWYAVLYGLSAAALFVVPSLVVRPHHHLPWSVVPIVIVAASVVLALQGPVLRARSGVGGSLDDPRRFPALRAPTILVAVIVVAGSALTWLAATSATWGVALACGVLCTLLLCAARLRALAAVRHDIRTGSTVAR